MVKTKRGQGLSLVPSAILLFVLSVILLFVAGYFHQRLATFRSYGLVGILLINLFGSATLFLPAPAIASVIAGGFIYPPVSVAYMAAFGASVGDMLGFLLGHSGKKVFIAQKDHKAYMVLTQFFERYGGFAVFLFAFIPNPFFDFIGITAGVFAYSPIRFFVLMFLGRFLRDLLLAFAGSRI